MSEKAKKMSKNLHFVKNIIKFAIGKVETKDILLYLLVIKIPLPPKAMKKNCPFLSLVYGACLAFCVLMFVQPLQAQRLYETSSQRYNGASVATLSGANAIQPSVGFQSTSPMSYSSGAYSGRSVQMPYRRYRVQINAIGAQNVQDVRVRRETGRPHDEEGEGGGGASGSNNPGEVGQQEQEYPLGEPYVLVLFALLTACVSVVRKSFENNSVR